MKGNNTKIIEEECVYIYATSLFAPKFPFPSINSNINRYGIEKETHGLYARWKVIPSRFGRKSRRSLRFRLILGVGNHEIGHGIGRGLDCRGLGFLTTIRDRSVGSCGLLGDSGSRFRWEGLGDGADSLASLLAVPGADGETFELGPVFAGDPVTGPGGEGGVSVLPLGDALDLVVVGGLVEEVPVELAAVGLGDVLEVHEGRQDGEHVVVAEDEDLGYGDGVEPSFDPAPDGGEEVGGADDENTWK